MLDEVLFALCPGDVLDVLEDGLERAELVEQGGRRLVADPRDSGDVVRGVALEADQVGHLVGPDAVPVEDARLVVEDGLRDALGGRHYPDVLPDQLEGIPIAGYHDGVDAPVGRLGCERRDHVVGFVALDRDVGVPEGIDQLDQVGPLVPEEVGFRWAVRLVLRVDLLPPRHAGIPCHDDLARVVLGNQLDQHRGEAEDRVGRPAVRGRHRIREGEKGPVGEAVPVDQEETTLGPRFAVLGHRPIIGPGDEPLDPGSVLRSPTRWEFV